MQISGNSSPAAPGAEGGVTEKKVGRSSDMRVKTENTNSARHPFQIPNISVCVPFILSLPVGSYYSIVFAESLKRVHDSLKDKQR